MKELKFRVWHKIRKEMYYAVLGVDFPDCCYCEHNAITKKRQLNLDKVGIMQFTTLKDKTGKDIYEGDVVLRFSKKLNMIVTWEEGSYHLRGINGNYIGNSLDDLKVIGNIYENPGLLEVKD